MAKSTPDGLAKMRTEYRGELDEKDLAGDWVAQFSAWLAEAVGFGLPEPNAMIVATADVEGRPSARTVLLKGFDERGLAFFTNYGSRKGREVLANPYASVVFPWHAMHRQVIACGPVVKTDREESEAYFDVRPRDSQLGAWASNQSQVIDDREALEQAFEQMADRFGEHVPCPPDWGGFRIIPETMEFWQGRPNRLHDRLRYRRVNESWTIERLAP